MVRVGVVGVGYWGPNLVRALMSMPGVSVEMVADLDETAIARLNARNPLLATTTDVDHLLGMDLDAVVIATPPSTHYELAREALLRGFDVFVEKPLSTTSADSADLVSLAADKQRVLMVGHIVEYAPAFSALRDMMASGELGEIRYLDSVRAGLGLFDPKSNVLWDLGPHEVALMLSLLGSIPERVSARGISCVHEGVADVVYMTLEFPDGILANTRMSWLDPLKTRRVNVVGSRKMVVYDELASQEKLRIFDKRVERIQPTDTFGEYQFSYHYGSVVSPHIELYEPLAAECLQFIDSVLSREHPPTDGISGLNVVRVLEAAQHSLDSGGIDVEISPVSLISTKDETVSESQAIGRAASS